MSHAPTQQDAVSLAACWEVEAERWMAWAQRPGHDSYWLYHRDQFLSLLPPPGRQTVDIGCGEGRLTRHLRDLGHRVIGIDAAPTLLAAARAADPAMDLRLADAAALPLGDGVADLAVAFMTLHDIEDLTAVIREIARILQPGSLLCAAIVHPLNSAGQFERPAADASFVIAGDYLTPFRFSDTLTRDGLTMTFHSQHRPLEAYVAALADAGFLVEALREPRVPDHAIGTEAGRRWQRLPLFLHMRARRS